jgi:Fur family ferric uptake transcriptional regulator
MVQALRDAGHRLTQPRLAVIRVLQENEEGLEPAEVHRQGRAYCQSLGLVTVYRTLDLLTDLGLVRRVHSEQQCHTYASAADGRHYLICQRCHRVTEFPCEGLAELIEGVRRRLGYTVTEHLLELSGVCPDCQALEAGDGADADAGRR